MFPFPFDCFSLSSLFSIVSHKTRYRQLKKEEFFLVVLQWFRYGLLLLLLHFLALSLLPQKADTHFLGTDLLWSVFWDLLCPLFCISDSTTWRSSLPEFLTYFESLSSFMLCWRKLVSRAATTWCFDEY